MSDAAATGGFLVIVLLALVFNALLALIPANIASKKGYSKGAFWLLGFFVSFIIAVIIALVIQPKPAGQMKPQSVSAPRQQGVLPSELKCPFCAEYISAEAKLCKHCRSNVEAQFAENLRLAQASLDAGFKAAQEDELQRHQLAERLRRLRRKTRPRLQLPCKQERWSGVKRSRNSLDRG